MTNLIGKLFGNILGAIYGFTGSYGIAIILFTFLVKLLLMPLTIKQTKSTVAMQEITPRVNEIQEKYKNNPERQNKEIMELYQKANINPMAGCLPLLIQFPILIGLFNLLKDPVGLGAFASQAAFNQANGQFLWMQNLTNPDTILAILSGASAFIMQKIMTPKEQLNGQMKMMTYMMAGLSFYWGFIFPAGLTLYWTVSNIFAILQQVIVTKPLKAKFEADMKEASKNGKKNKNKK